MVRIFLILELEKICFVGLIVGFGMYIYGFLIFFKKEFICLEVVLKVFDVFVGNFLKLVLRNLVIEKRVLEEFIGKIRVLFFLIYVRINFVNKEVDVLFRKSFLVCVCGSLYLFCK